MHDSDNSIHNDKENMYSTKGLLISNSQKRRNWLYAPFMGRVCNKCFTVKTIQLMILRFFNTGKAFWIRHSFHQYCRHNKELNSQLMYDTHSLSRKKQFKCSKNKQATRNEQIKLYHSHNSCKNQTIINYVICISF